MGDLIISLSLLIFYVIIFISPAHIPRIAAYSSFSSSSKDKMRNFFSTRKGEGKNYLYSLFFFAIPRRSRCSIWVIDVILPKFNFHSIHKYYRKAKRMRASKRRRWYEGELRKIRRVFCANRQLMARQFFFLLSCIK